MNESMDTENSKSNIQVISRAVTILRSLKEYPNGLSLGQIAKHVGLAKSTVQRIVNTLEEEGLVVHASSGGVRLGPGLAILGAAVHFDLREDIHPFLQQLSIELDETVDLAILEHGKAFFIDQITATHRLQAVSKIGASFPLHCTANGKALLAAMDSDMISHFHQEQLTKFTPNTITSYDELTKELEIISKDGVAFDKEEHSIGICAVGATIRDAFGNIAAISIPLPSTRFYGNEDKLVTELKKTCKIIHKRYGY
jgi:DNA-binding IclR family transcriptional regulator